MPLLNVENAQIKTASVEIKTLTVSGKQVTLSVFRQIIQEDLFDTRNLKLNGVPWGIVNYFWKEDNQDFKIHVVWQKGKELRRSLIFKNPCHRYHYLCTTGYSEIKEICDDLKEDILYLKDKNNSNVFMDAIDKCDQIKPLQSFIERRIYDIDNIKNGRSSLNLEEYELYKKRAEIKMDSLQQKLNELMESYNEAEKERINYISEYNKLMVPLLELPHLFIAV